MNFSPLLLVYPYLVHEVYNQIGCGQLTDHLGHSCCGVSVYGPRVDCREFITMGNLSIVFQVELIAILMCTELFLSKIVMKENTYLL